MAGTAQGGQLRSPHLAAVYAICDAITTSDKKIVTHLEADKL